MNCPHCNDHFQGCDRCPVPRPPREDWPCIVRLRALLDALILFDPIGALFMHEALSLQLDEWTEFKAVKSRVEEEVTETSSVVLEVLARYSCKAKERKR